MNQTFTRSLFIVIGVLCGFILGGCSSSGENIKDTPKQFSSEPSATEVMTTTMNNLKMQNDSLKLRIVSLEQMHRSSIARTAELETQLSDLKTMTPPPETVKSTLADLNESYDDALHLFRSRNYHESAATLQRILINDSSSDLADNCHYWLGECAYAMRRYQEALGHFQKVFDFKLSEKKDDAQIMIAHCYYAQGDKANAKKEYSKFLEKFPASPYAARAKERLNKL